MWAPYTVPITPAPTMSTFMTSSSDLASAAHVLAGGVAEGGVPFAAQGRRLDVRAGPGVGPLGPVFPPRALVLGGRGAPGVRTGPGVVARLVPGLRAGRVDDAGDVAAAGQHVADLAAEQPGGLERSVPGHDVVVDRAHHVGVVLHRR